MSKSRNSQAEAIPQQPETIQQQPETIPNPPGGGSWTWDDDAKQWIPREQPTEPTNQTEE
ncbi:hypothetical protein [Noviherbaspirillum denitrificans]|uniref:Uncharacterized protein n=1 Tax=Noviherbaspirillum denitrificans TaxID=1968433 RepID=A0A254T6Y8_9BURK|nr:hypothetical protein [Noviherbaspirillum denitrificans]OWW18411.1 hypothetical protein AYR66_01005 [Noviherbaspirillum denitrificans]OWW19375.1 hypothetical protein AYR66_07490 [Noviherbaspirillum denitrificans]